MYCHLFFWFTVYIISANKYTEQYIKSVQYKTHTEQVHNMLTTCALFRRKVANKKWKAHQKRVQKQATCKAAELKSSRHEARDCTQTVQQLSLQAGFQWRYDHMHLNTHSIKSRQWSHATHIHSLVNVVHNGIGVIYGNKRVPVPPLLDWSTIPQLFTIKKWRICWYLLSTKAIWGD